MASGSAAEHALQHLAMEVMRSAENGDLVALRAAHTPDALIWLNSRGSALSLDEHRASSGALRARIARVHFVDIRVQPFDDESGFIQQHNAVCEFTDGSRITVAGCFVCRVRDGKVSRRDEYIDSASLARALDAGQ